MATTPFESANARTQSVIRIAASITCVAIAVLCAALSVATFAHGAPRWTFYPLAVILAASVVASISSFLGRVSVGVIILITAIEVVIVGLPYFLLSHPEDLHLYLMTSTVGFAVNMLLAGLFAPRALIIALTAASAVDLVIVAELSEDVAARAAAPFLGTGLLVTGALAFLFTTLFRSALKAARDEDTRSAALREQLLHAQKMEAIGRLAGGIAHDFNNILTAINGQTELLLVDDALPGEAQGPLLEVRRYVTKATRLIRQLLVFSRRETTAVPKPFDAREALAGLENMLERVIGRDVRLSIDAAGEPLIVPVDQGQFEQVVMNLVVNAHDAMPRGGTIDIAVRRVHAAQEETMASGPLKPGMYAALSVRDTGTGMDEAVLSRLFEPFFTTKPEGKGTGLGLSTVYGIVTQNGGAIEVSTEVGEGSTFTVYLPSLEARL
jgi:signal transduction histidine kinase